MSGSTAVIDVARTFSGPEYVGRAWCCVTPTVQIVEQANVKGQKRFVVLTLFALRVTDKRYPPSPLLTLHRARVFAFDRLRSLSSSGDLKVGGRSGIDFARGGAYLGLEVPL